MNKVVLFLKRHKIISFVVLIAVFSFVYSHITSYLLSLEIRNSISQNIIINEFNNDIEHVFSALGYETRLEVDNMYYGYYLVAKNGDAEISIGYEESVKNENVDFYFSSTQKEITPFICNIEWLDSISTVKRKLGINWLNTRYTSLIKFDTSIYVGSDWITFTSNNTNEYPYTLYFNDKKELYKIEVLY